MQKAAERPTVTENGGHNIPCEEQQAPVIPPDNWVLSVLGVWLVGTDPLGCFHKQWPRTSTSL